MPNRSDSSPHGDREEFALRIALQGLRDIATAEEAVRRQSLRYLMEQASLVDECFLLLAAARDIVSARGGLSVAEKVALTLATLQWELLWVAWNSLLTARYAATLSSFRLIDELSDYIVAARLDEQGAQKLLEREEWSVGSARAVIEKELVAQGSDDAGEWAAGRKSLRNELHQLAHTSGALAEFAVRAEEDDITLPVVPQIRPEVAKQLADLLVQLASDALVALGIAFGDDLPDGGAWSNRQRTIWRRVHTPTE